MARMSTMIVLSSGIDVSTLTRYLNQYFVDRHYPWNWRPIIELREMLHNRAPNADYNEDAPNFYGGVRVIEQAIFLGSYNYLDLDDFIQYLNTKGFEYPGY